MFKFQDLYKNSRPGIQIFKFQVFQDPVVFHVCVCVYGYTHLFIHIHIGV